MARSGLIVLAHSVAGHQRAERLFEGLDAELVLCGAGGEGVRRAVRAVRLSGPSVTYLVDVGESTAVASVAAKARRSKVVVDTGDLAFALVKSAGLKGPAGSAAVWAGERMMLGLADHVVVRGATHVAMVRKPATFISDIAPASARPVDGSAVRARLGWEGRFVVGLVGTLVWAPRLGTAYGWDLIEALPHAQEDVAALIVGDGDARDRLERRARELGVADRCVFAGSLPLDELPEWIAAMDAGLSTQTNDDVGAVRTTAKVPLYLACGCPVVATDVGEARRVLGPLGWTLRYDGVVDREYPLRLARRIEEWRCTPELAPARRHAALALSAEEYDPARAQARLVEVLAKVAALR